MMAADNHSGLSPALEAETRKLSRSWMRHDAAMLRDYLVADVEDPRVNAQSILSRHFLTETLTQNVPLDLMREELEFSAAINQLRPLLKKLGDEEGTAALRHAFDVASDNCEGYEVPRFLLALDRTLPRTLGEVGIPNYVRAWLDLGRDENGLLDTFQAPWTRFHSNLESNTRVRVLEPACGSANDYRYWGAYGLARWLDYHGFDLCEKNVVNARVLCPGPGASFSAGNVFAIEAPNRAFDAAIVHDLFEHLSPEGMERAFAEVARVTRRALCLHFFNMEDVSEHCIEPYEDYYWNRLSAGRVREVLGVLGFRTRVIHIGSLLREITGAPSTHNPQAWTFIAWRPGAD
jgi:hypothetical protein